MDEWAIATEEPVAKPKESQNSRPSQLRDITESPSDDLCVAAEEDALASACARLVDEHWQQRKLSRSQGTIGRPQPSGIMPAVQEANIIAVPARREKVQPDIDTPEPCMTSGNFATALGTRIHTTRPEEICPDSLALLDDPENNIIEELGCRLPCTGAASLAPLAWSITSMDSSATSAPCQAEAVSYMIASRQEAQNRVCAEIWDIELEYNALETDEAKAKTRIAQKPQAGENSSVDAVDETAFLRSVVRAGVFEQHVSGLNVSAALREKESTQGFPPITSECDLGSQNARRLRQHLVPQREIHAEPIEIAQKPRVEENSIANALDQIAVFEADIRADVLDFLHRQHVSDLNLLAHLLEEDLTAAFPLVTSGFGLGERSAVRRLRQHVMQEQACNLDHQGIHKKSQQEKTEITNALDQISGLDDSIRAGVCDFLRKQGVSDLNLLSSLLEEDLTACFPLNGSDFSLGHRSAVRRLRQHVIQQQENCSEPEPQPQSPSPTPKRQKLRIHGRPTRFMPQLLFSHIPKPQTLSQQEMTPHFGLEDATATTARPPLMNDSATCSVISDADSCISSMSLSDSSRSHPSQSIQLVDNEGTKMRRRAHETVVEFSSIAAGREEGERTCTDLHWLDCSAEPLDSKLLAVSDMPLPWTKANVEKRSAPSFADAVNKGDFGTVWRGRHEDANMGCLEKSIGERRAPTGDQEHEILGFLRSSCNPCIESFFEPWHMDDRFCYKIWGSFSNGALTSQMSRGASIEHYQAGRLQTFCLCGNEFVPDARFCRKCGRKRELLQQEAFRRSQICLGQSSLGSEHSNLLFRENLCLDVRAHAKLTCCDLVPAHEKLGMEFELCGTSGFMAPEIRNSSWYGQVDDMFSFGTLAWVSPTHGDQSNTCSPPIRLCDRSHTSKKEIESLEEVPRKFVITSWLNSFAISRAMAYQ